MLLGGLTLSDLISLVFSFITAVAASYLAYAALVHASRPRARVQLIEPKILYAGEKVVFVLRFQNIGYWYAKPMIVEMSIYINFENTFVLKEMRYGSTLQKKSEEVRIGKGNMNYFKAKGMDLSYGDEAEEIQIVAQLPEATGQYRIKVTAFSDNGLSLSRVFKVRVLPRSPKSSASRSGDPLATDANVQEKRKRLALVFVGCTGSGKTFLSCYVASKHHFFVKFVKSTTRELRACETNRVDYEFVDEESFQSMLMNGKLVHVKKSDFDNAYYGVDKERLLSLFREERAPIFTCHSIEEAGTLRNCLRQLDISTVCIYLYGSEADRKRALIEVGAVERFKTRREMDLALKLQAYGSGFDGCDYVVVNTYDEDTIAQIDTIVSVIEKGTVAPTYDYAMVRAKVEADLLDVMRCAEALPYGIDPTNEIL